MYTRENSDVYAIINVYDARETYRSTSGVFHMPSMRIGVCNEANKVGKGNKRYINANKPRCKVKRYRMMKT